MRPRSFSAVASAMNSGVLSSIAGRDDVIFADRLIHSLRLMARAWAVAHQRSRTTMSTCWRSYCATHHATDIVIVCESVRMDGDLAPFVELRRLANDYDATLLTDEAHAIGVFGRGGD